MSFWDNLTLAEELLGCYFDWEMFPWEVFVVSILQVESQFWVTKEGGRAGNFSRSFLGWLRLSWKRFGLRFLIGKLWKLLDISILWIECQLWFTDEGGNASRFCRIVFWDNLVLAEKKFWVAIFHWVNILWKVFCLFDFTGWASSLVKKGEMLAVFSVAFGDNLTWADTFLGCSFWLGSFSLDNFLSFWSLRLSVTFGWLKGPPNAVLFSHSSLGSWAQKCLGVAIFNWEWFFLRCILSFWFFRLLGNIRWLTAGKCWPFLSHCLLG